MRYIVEVEELSAEVLEKLKKNSRIIHIFSFYESGKAKLMLRDALNIIGIFGCA